MTIDTKLLGEKIKRLRRRQNKTQQQIADQCGISKSLLSKIENGKAATAIATLSKISEALDVRLTYLVDDQNERDIEIMEYLRRPDKVVDENMGYSYEQLAKRSKFSMIEPTVVYVTPKDQMTRKEPYTHSQDEFIYILEGAIYLLYDGEKHYMSQHDTAYFDGSKPHIFLPVDNHSAKVITILVEK
ncbi:helix-turn-helix domain-containing protein [Alkalibacillus aidingensis]|uniref:helix-turn-helix domain-containing protein n=1 Tax=Alkalibacillus aidingensis TaxID=2747607 RepID=UPI0016602EC3|nr:XRE family transcriptional regulator [Alkalibacillus aidingensis]